uniref:Uncharacterized protein n=1 Tax=Arundo donax TaxID=35708 RepID=A0A0A9HD45_ARUDO
MCCAQNDKCCILPLVLKYYLFLK